MIHIGIYTDEGSRGYVHYEPSTKEVVVSHPSSDIRTKVYKFLTTEREVRVPMSDNMGDFQDFTIIPSDNQGYLEITLCEMYHRIGVHVDWTDKGENIVKSDKEVYYIIN